MTNFKELSNLDEMKLMASGNPQKLAAYTIKRRELDEIKATHFNEDFPFVNGFSQSYLDELKAYSEANPEDESAQVRYQLQKERFAVQEASRTAHIDKRLVKTDLMRKLQAGELVDADLKAAHRLAKTNSSLENMTLYSRIKRQLNGGNE